MPFRLINPSATYQAFINNILREYLNYFIVIYLDNILIYSKNEKEYTGYIIKVLEVLEKTELKINEKKSTFH
jgi:Reverse transcriptase (RNA-dependent DNA polymerase)